MANSKDPVPVDFLEELLPYCQHIPLLYHISYLCLAHCPQSERLLCMRAVETRFLFASSENVLMRSAGTSQNLVSSLFPMLSLAIEANEPVLAKKILEAAEICITENVKDVDKMMERFAVLNQDMAMTTSDIILENRKADRLCEQPSHEIQEIIKTIKYFEDQMNHTTEQLAGTEKQIEAKNQELQNFASDSASKRQRFSFVDALVPFSGPLAKPIHDARTSVGTAEINSSLKADLNHLHAKKVSMKQNEWSLQVQKIDWNMKLAKLIIEKGAIPDPVFLREVQRYLSKIQSIFIQLTSLWTKMLNLLGIIKNKTFVGEDLVDDPDFKAEFLKSIQKASEVWETFRERCIKGAQIVRVQSKDAYTFLEIDPASLSQAVWQKAYDSVKEQLLQLQVLG